MTQPPPHTIPESVARDAVALLLDWQMQAEPDSWERIRRWRAQHPDHERAWRQIEATQQQLSGLSDSQRQLAHQTLRQSKYGRRRTLKMLSLLCIGVGAGWSVSQPALLNPGQDQHHTGIGEQLDIALPDGGMLTLNSRSAVRLRYTAELTELHLLQGEVFVYTGTETRRAMQVTTAQGVLTPLGTAFNVHQQDHSTEVAVVAGQVMLIQGPVSEPHLITTGEVLRFSNSELLLQRPLLAADTAWRQGMLIADNLPLPAFIRELDRYHHGVIRIDPALNSLRVSGSYPIEDTQRVLQSLSHSLPITLEQRSRYWISLRPATSQQKQ